MEIDELNRNNSHRDIQTKKHKGTNKNTYTHTLTLTLTYTQEIKIQSTINKCTTRKRIEKETYKIYVERYIETEKGSVSGGEEDR